MVVFLLDRQDLPQQRVSRVAGHDAVKKFDWNKGWKLFFASDFSVRINRIGQTNGLAKRASVADCPLHRSLPIDFSGFGSVLRKICDGTLLSGTDKVGLGR